MSLKVKISGVNLVLSGLDKYADDVQRLVSEEVRDWAERTESAAKSDPVLPIDTGALKNSIRSVLGADKLTWIVKVGGINGVNYAPYVVFGTGAFVDEAFLQQYGLVSYAAQFKGAGVREVNLPMRDFLYRNSAIEFQKTFDNIKRILKADERSRELRK